MLALLISFIPHLNVHHTPFAQVAVETAEFEAVFVPAGHEGPIVAVPLDEAVF